MCIDYYLKILSSQNPSRLNLRIEDEVRLPRTNSGQLLVPLSWILQAVNRLISLRYYSQFYFPCHNRIDSLEKVNGALLTNKGSPRLTHEL